MKIICLGRNYTQPNHPVDHLPEPIVFLKPDSSLLKDSKPFFIPDFAKEFEYEGELVFRINRLGKNVSERFAHRYYDAVTVGMDLMATDMLSESSSQGLPWDLSKGFDGSAVIGDFVPVDHLNVENLRFSVRMHDEVLQRGNSSDLIWSIDQIIAYVSKYYTLKIGDLIFTGAPQGSKKLVIGQCLEGYLEDKKVLKLDIR